MKIIRHDAYIAKRKRNSKWTAALGFLMRSGTLFRAINPAFLLPSYVLMLVGFVHFNIVIHQHGKCYRRPRNDQAMHYHLSSRT